MKIETLVNLTGADLLNRPYISEVVYFTDNPEKVTRGSCFFGNKKTDIQKAVKNGAYAVVTDKDTPILDSEIAWMKVEDLKKAIFNVFKYENLKHRIYLTDKISLLFIEKMSLDKRVVVLKRSKDFLKAINLNDKFLFTDEKSYKDVFPNMSELKKASLPLKQISLFKTSFKGTELNFPFVYAESFSKVYNFFEEREIKYTLDFELPRFKPVFVNYRLEEVEYGKSDRVVITGLENDEVFFDELNYIVSNTKHAKTVFINAKNKHLLKKPFNFAVMVSTPFHPKTYEEKRLF
jgi:ferrochelatase